MEFNTGELVSDSSNIGMRCVDSGEMNLYDELSTFIELSPEDRRKQPDSVGKKPREDAIGEPTPVERIAARSTTANGEAVPELPDLTRPSGPLAGLILSPEFAFSGAMTRGVCLACGAESGDNDVFCVACGAFIDEGGSAVPKKPTCTECGARIVADEIFCPGCGASLPVA